MHVISQSRLRDFWEIYPESEMPLRAWHQTAEHSTWLSFDDIKQTYAHANQVGKCIVFNIGGNKFRLVVVVNYCYGKIYVRNVMTHAEYSRYRWRDACLCN